MVCKGMSVPLEKRPGGPYADANVLVPGGGGECGSDIGGFCEVMVGIRDRSATSRIRNKEESAAYDNQ